MNRVFTERLVGRIDIDLHINKLEVWIHLLVQESKESSNILWSLIPRFDTEICEVRQFE